MKKWSITLILMVVIFGTLAVERVESQINVCGDFNGDGNLNIGDVVSGMDYLFREGPPAVDFDTADVDHLLLYTLHDAQAMLNCIFHCGPSGASCAPVASPLIATPDSRYVFGYEGFIPAGYTEYGIRFGMDGEPVNLESFVAPVRITIGGAPAAIDSIVFDSIVPFPASDIRDSGVVVLATLSFPSGPWDNGFLGRIFVTVASSTTSHPVDMVWDTLTPMQAPPEQGGSVYPLFTVEGDVSAFLPDLSSKCCWTAGDFDNDGAFNIADVTAGIAHIFNGSVPPVCQDQADANGDNAFNIADITYGIARIFGGGPAPICGATGS